MRAVRAGRLHDENIGAADVLVDLERDFRVRETASAAPARATRPETPRSRAPAPDARCRKKFSARRTRRPCTDRSCTRQPSRSWLGRKDSNLRIRDPKSRALPLGHAPTIVLRTGEVTFRRPGLRSANVKCSRQTHLAASRRHIARLSVGVTNSARAGQRRRAARLCIRSGARTSQKPPTRCPKATRGRRLPYSSARTSWRRPGAAWRPLSADRSSRSAWPAVLPAAGCRPVDPTSRTRLWC